MFSISIYFQIIKGIIQNKSLCRILQIIEFKKNFITGNVLEFGTTPESKNNFSKLANIKKIKKIEYCDKNIKHKKVINLDLNKKNNLRKNHYDTILFFNIMEHLSNFANSKLEIKKIMKKNSILIGSTPFLYRYHNAPSDYLRFTKPYLNHFFKKDYKILSIKNLGFGPFCLSYSFLSDFTKKIPLLNTILFTIAYILDFVLSFFVKYNLEDVYPIAIFFRLKK